MKILLCMIYSSFTLDEISFNTQLCRGSGENFFLCANVRKTEKALLPFPAVFYTMFRFLRICISHEPYCYGSNCTPPHPKCLCQSPKPQDLRM